MPSRGTGVDVTVGGAGVSVAPGVSVGGSVDVMMNTAGAAGVAPEISRLHAVSINRNNVEIRIA